MSNPEKTQPNIKVPIKKTISPSKPLKEVQKGILNKTVIVASLVSAIITGYVVSHQKEKQIDSAEESIVFWKAEVVKLKSQANLAFKPASVVEPDIKQELKEFIRQCDEENNGESCYKAHSHFMRMDNLVSATFALKRSCLFLKYEPACLKGTDLLSFFVRDVDISQKFMVELASELCSLGTARGCNVMTAYYFYEKKNYTESLKYALRGCEELKDGRSCWSAGLSYYEVSRNYKKAYEYFVRSCEMKFSTGCADAGLIAEDVGLPEKKEYFNKLACEGGEKDFCDTKNAPTRMPANRI